MTSRRALEGDLARLAGLLARGERADVASARGMVAALRRALRSRPVNAAVEVTMEIQAAFPLRMPSGFPVSDCPLGCPISAVQCVARQLLSEREIGAGSRAAPRSSPAKRGRTPTRPTCVTARCEVGAFVREAHGDTAEAKAMAARAPRAADTSES